MADSDYNNKYTTGDRDSDELLEQILREAGYVHVSDSPLEENKTLLSSYASSYRPASVSGSASSATGRISAVPGSASSATGRISSSTGSLGGKHLREPVQSDSLPLSLTESYADSVISANGNAAPQHARPALSLENRTAPQAIPQPVPAPTLNLPVSGSTNTAPTTQTASPRAVAPTVQTATHRAVAPTTQTASPGAVAPTVQTATHRAVAPTAQTASPRTVAPVTQATTTGAAPTQITPPVSKAVSEAPAKPKSSAAPQSPTKPQAPAATSPNSDSFHNVILKSSIISFEQNKAPVTDATTVVSSGFSAKASAKNRQSFAESERGSAANNKDNKAPASRASEQKKKPGSASDNTKSSESEKPAKKPLSPKKIIIFIAVAAVLLFIVAFISVKAVDSREYDKYIASAIEKYDQEDYDSCLTYLRKASAINSPDELKIMMAECYKHQGNYILAIDVLREIKKPDEEILEDIRRLEDLVSSTAAQQEYTIAGKKVSGNVTSLNLDNMSLTDEDVKTIAGLYSLTGLSIQNAGLTDITPLAGLGGLVELNLTGNKIADISALASLTELHTLVLDGNPVTDFSALDSLNTLATLSIKGIAVPKETLETLSAAHPNCAIKTDSSDTADAEITLGGKTFRADSDTLVLSGLGIKDISVLSQCKELKFLDLSGNSIYDITPLMSIPSLETLVLSDNSISNIYPLMGMSSLVSLHLENNSITSVKALTSLKNLRELYLSGNRIDSYTGFEDLIYLETLDISSTELTDTVLLTLKEVFSLKLLNIKDNSSITANSVDTLKNNLTMCSVQSDDLPYVITINGNDYMDNITELNLSNANISDITAVLKFKNLVSLNLSSNLLSNIYSLEYCNFLTTLKTLNLSKNGIVDINILSKFTNIESLDVSGNHINAVTPFASMTTLKELNVTDCGFSEADILYICNALPNCRIYY